MTVAQGNDERRRVRVWLGAPGDGDRILLSAYLTEVTVADKYQACLCEFYPGLAVTVDRLITDDLKPMPCERLWKLAP